MRAETERFLAKGARLLSEAHTLLDIELYDAAGRAAYLAAFHAAQALIFERSGKIGKTHNGVHAEFQRVTRAAEAINPDLRAFLSRAYNLKTIADYEVGPEAGVTGEVATEAVATAERFVTYFTRLLGDEDA